MQAMKRQRTFTVAVLSLVLIGGLWLLDRRGRPDLQPVPPPRAAPSSDARVGDRSAVRSPSGATALSSPHLKQAEAVVQPKPTAGGQSGDISASSNPAQLGAVSQVLAELKRLYGPVGSLKWEQAKALIAEREGATQELVDRLAKLGPGGARAIASGYVEADSTRAKLLLVRALGKLNDAEAAGMLQDMLGRDESFSLRKEMVAALGQRRDGEAEQALTGVLAQQDDAQLRFASAQALSGRETALPALTERLRTDSSPDVRKELVRSIGLVRSAPAMRALAEVARSRTDITVRQTAIQELGRSFGASALGVLDGLLNDPDELIRHNAVKALARVKTDQAFALLQQRATTDSSVAVREAAAGAVAALRSQAGASSQGQRR
jgi:HEAT repeat protein